MPALSLLLSWLEWGGKYHKTEPGAREANGCIPPSTSTSTARLHQSLLSTVPASRFISSHTEHRYTYCRVKYLFLFPPFFYFTSEKSLRTAVIFHFCLHYLSLQLYTVSQITSPLSSALTYTVEALRYMTDTLILQLCSLLCTRDFFFLCFFFF